MHTRSFLFSSRNLQVVGAALALGAVLGIPDDANAATRLVPGEYSTVQAAIDAAAASGDEIVVTGGPYTEALVVNGKSLTLRGPALPAFGPEIRSGGVALTVGGGAQVSISNIVFFGGDTHDAVRAMGAARLSLANCRIFGGNGQQTGGDGTSGGHGVSASNTAELEIVSCVIRGGGGGMAAPAPSNSSAFNGGAGGDAVRLDTVAAATISGSRLVGAGGGNGSCNLVFCGSGGAGGSAIHGIGTTSITGGAGNTAKRGLAGSGYSNGAAGELLLLEGGASLDGNPPAQLTAIDWATIMPPADVLAVTGFAAGPLFGRVWIDAVTDLPGGAPGLEAQLGLGDSGTSPVLWTDWATVTNWDRNEGNDDVYRAGPVSDTPVEKAFAWRFRLDGGPWTYADLDSITNGFSLAQLGNLKVEQPGPVIDGRLVGSEGPWLIMDEATYARPVRGGSATTSDAIGEASTFHFFSVAQGRDVACTIDNRGDLINVYAWANATYLYIGIAGPTAPFADFNEADSLASGDIGDLFVAIDAGGATGASGSLRASEGHGGFTTSQNEWKAVNFTGWKPTHVLGVQWADNREGVTPVGGYANVVDVLVSSETAGESMGKGDGGFEWNAKIFTNTAYDTHNTKDAGEFEFAIPWTALGIQQGGPAPGTPIRLAAYVTYNSAGHDAFDSAPGIGNGGPFESIGDCPGDLDGSGALGGCDSPGATGAEGSDPNIGPSTGETPGPDDSMDTIGEYFEWVPFAGSVATPTPTATETVTPTATPQEAKSGVMVY